MKNSLLPAFSGYSPLTFFFTLAWYACLIWVIYFNRTKGYWYLLVEIIQSSWLTFLHPCTRLPYQIKVAFFLTKLLGLHGNVRSIISAIKSLWGNVKSPICQSPSPHWGGLRNLQTHRNIYVPLSILFIFSFPLSSFCSSCSLHSHWWRDEHWPQVDKHC